MIAWLVFASSAALGATPVLTSSAGAEKLRALSVWIGETARAEGEKDSVMLESTTLRAFSGALFDAASSVFGWRRWTLAGREEDASATVSSTLVRFKKNRCKASVELVDRIDPRRSTKLKEDIVPCNADNVLGIATDLGRRIADGPRAPVTVTLDLTPRNLPSIDLPDLPDIQQDRETNTSTRARRGFTLERALEIYRFKHMFVFEDESRPDSVFVARDNHLVNECDLRRAASAPLTNEMLEFCEGNNWEYAWAGVPIGILIGAVGLSDVQNGGWFTLLFGVGIAATSAAVASVFNVDANDLESGKHFSSRQQIEAIVQKSNANLREVLDLTEAEVEVAGMRR